jgi:deoxyribonuclease-1-like protein
MRRFLLSLSLLLLFLPAASPQSGDSLKFVSWNIQNFGRSKDNSQIRQMAQYLRDFDLVAIQEVVPNHTSGPKAVAQLADELNRMGAKWDYAISDPTDSPPFKSERYAFLWKTSRVKIVGRPWLQASLPETVYREPYMGRFEWNGKRLIIANFHARRRADKPEEEIPLLADLPLRYSKDLVIIAGDFNLPEFFPAFDPLRELGYRPVLQGQPTSLRQTCRDDYFSGELDNIFIPSGVNLLSGRIIDIVGECANLKAARGLSDHLPVVAVIHIP